MIFFLIKSKVTSNLNLINHSIIVILKNTHLFYFSASTDLFQQIGTGYKLYVNIVIKIIENDILK